MSSARWIGETNQRYLQNESSPSSAPSAAPSAGAQPVNPDDSRVLLTTLIIYGTLFVIIWLLLCWLRLRNPRVYNIREWVKDIRCKLAKSQYGFVSWIWEVYDIPEKQIMDQCGMDALCLVRILRWAVKVAVLGAFNALWLIPVYGSSEEGEDTAYITDYIASITVTNVPESSPRLIATTIASYIFFGGALYLLYEEVEYWFPAMRFRFLAQPRARNYSVYVHGIPDEYKADYDLADFFQESFGLGRVQEAHVKLRTPVLLQRTVERNTAVSKLEHALNVKEVQGITPTHKINKIEVDSIETYALELQAINLEITERIDFLEVGGYDSDDPEAQYVHPGHDEGEPMDGGFITFYNLSSTQAAKQMNHARMPFEMQVLEAPDPSDILWSNVGKNHLQLQLGKLSSIVLTVTICLLWTFPIAFFSGISSIEGLEDRFEFIKTANENHPALRQVLAQVAPLLVVIVNALLPVILTKLSIMEGHISNAMVQASLFTKLAAFSVIQTFFVSAFGGSLFAQLSAIVEDPGKIVELLANELPTKSTFFIQIIFITTVLGLGIELLRIVPVVMASLRGCIGPNLTEKERNSPYLFFSPLAVPPLFNHASVHSTVVLFCMILFVYAVIAPLTSIILILSFLVMGSAYRHQLIYIYPPSRESGGRLWMSFVGIIINCMIVAQLTVLGLLALKKGSYASPLIIPLLILTILFKAYIGQRHFQAFECLPSHECFLRDASSDFYITESFEDLYVQPELLIKEVLPENIGSKLRKRISLVERKRKGKKKKKRQNRSLGKRSAKTEPVYRSDRMEEVEPSPASYG